MADLIEQTNNAILEEMQKWEKLQVHPKQFANLDGLLLSTKFDILITYLLENKIIDESSYELQFKQELLKRLREMRPAVEEHLERMQQDIIRVEKRLFGPNGEVL